MPTEGQIPTLRQFEALRYVYFMQLTQEEAAVRMGITRQGVAKHLRKLSKMHHVFADMVCPKQATTKKKLSYYVAMDYDVDETF